MPNRPSGKRFAPVTFLRTLLSPPNLRRSMARGVANQLLRMLDRSDDEGLIRLTRLGERLAPIPHFKAQMRQLRELFEQHHPCLELTRQLVSDIHPNCSNALIEAVPISTAWMGQPIRQAVQKKHGVFPPFLMVMSPTMRCNLDCLGCYAGKYPKGKDPLDLETLDRIVREGKEMGTHMFIISGGEPFVRRDLFELYEQHPDCWFQIYTNGLLIDDKTVERIVELGNVAPAISVEGWRE